MPIICWRWPGNTVYLSHGERTTIGEVEVATIEVTKTMTSLGYLLKVDGLTFYYAGMPASVRKTWTPTRTNWSLSRNTPTVSTWRFSPWPSRTKKSLLSSSSSRGSIHERSSCWIRTGGSACCPRWREK